MEQWKLVLADNIYTYGRAGKKVGNGYVMNVVCVNSDVREDVRKAIYNGVNEGNLSTDFKRADSSYADGLTINVTLGSSQAQDEFERNLAAINNEVARWRKTGYATDEDKLKADLEAKQAEIEAKTAEINRQKDKDTWGIIMVMCVAAAIVLLIYE